jgi:hypothetical protein
LLARFACNDVNSTPIREGASIDAIPEFECNFYNSNAICDIGKGITKATLARKILFARLPRLILGLLEVDRYLFCGPL